MPRPVSLSRQHREEAHLTRREVARSLRVAESSIARWEGAGWRHLYLAEQACRLYQRRGVACRVDDFGCGAPGRGGAMKTAKNR